MKVGDLVRHVLSHKHENMIGIILGIVEQPRSDNDVFNVLWNDGKIGMVVELLHAASTLPLANVMVSGAIDQFYIDELEKV